MIQFNITYFQGTHGWLKLGQFVLCIVLFICLGSADSSSGTGFVWFTVVVSFLLVVLFIACHLLRIPDLLNNLPWLIIELGHSVLWLICYAISFLIAAINSSHSRTPSALAATSFFSIVNAALFGLDFYLYFQVYRHGAATVTQSAPPIPTSTANYQTSP